MLINVGTNCLVYKWLIGFSCIFWTDNACFHGFFNIFFLLRKLQFLHLFWKSFNFWRFLCRLFLRLFGWLFGWWFSCWLFGSSFSCWSFGSSFSGLFVIWRSSFRSLRWVIRTLRCLRQGFLYFHLVFSISTKKRAAEEGCCNFNISLSHIIWKPQLSNSSW